jgi:hypothetical protein
LQVLILFKKPLEMSILNTNLEFAPKLTIPAQIKKSLLEYTKTKPLSSA